MTIRLFRRKSGTTTPSSSEERGTEPQSTNTDSPKRPSRRRRGGAKTGQTTAAITSPPPVAAQPAVTAPQARPGGRSRRGRRGGARRKAAQAAGANNAAATTAATAAVPPAAPVEPRPLDGAHPVTLEQLVDAQLSVLKSVQGSLAAIETRLADMSRLGAEQPRLGIFVDVPNIMYAAERMKVSISYTKLLQFMVRGRELVRASAYAPISDDPQEPLATQRFVQPFIGNGYSMVTKPLKRYADGSIKANFDVELALDILTMCDRLDTVVLVSGDSDFRRVVELVASKGVRVEVVAFGDSTSVELRAAADEYIDIKDHLAELRTK
jgi:uncharacterized LabA/DUF88 family protein